MKYFILEKDEGIATLTMNRPDRLNAFNLEMGDELGEALEMIRQDKDIRVLIITGAGQAFSTGGDFLDVFDANVKQDGLLDESMIESTLESPLRDMVPTIAAINGPAIGGGMTIALLCDIRIASEEATISFPFVRVGVLPEGGSTFILPRLIGIAKACELTLTGRTVGAKEAKEIGLVNDVVPASELKEAANKMARRIARGAPLAVKMTKQGLYQGLQCSVEEAEEFENKTIMALMKTEDHKEAVKAFMEKREPKFMGK